ncbi:MAG TPA: PKD domain-containing protein [Solirubrobacteraceae bacterium]|nr:PKD domain-containing protein [Solirubrobacteraceae bacterium]
MKRLLDHIRRHRRVSAGVAAILVGGIALLALRSTESARSDSSAAHAPASSSVVASAARTPDVPTPAAPTSRVAFAARTVHSTAARRHSRLNRATTRRGIPTAAPNTTDLAQALKRSTGLAPTQVTAQSACPATAMGQARCAAEVLVLRSNHSRVRPLARPRAELRPTKPAQTGSATEPQAFTPEYLQQAYDLTGLSSAGGDGDTVAIIDVGDDPTAASDLATYREAYDLGPCGTGCFAKVNENGQSSPLPAENASWQTEESLDLDAVSALCPNCHILLVEASTASWSDLDTAMETAYSMGADQISDSWTDQVPSDELSELESGPYAFPSPPVATVAATGDTGYVSPNPYGDVYPAAFPGVTAAGGTTIAPATGANVRGFGEAVWNDGEGAGGSGCDVNVTKPSYQTDTGCRGRSYSDISADADPETGLLVYDTAAGGWEYVGGTSLATPLIAAYYAITQVDDSTPEWAYTDSGLLNDITSGSNGTCPHHILYICNAGPGYDGPTGVGSISGDVTAGAPGIGGPSIPTSSANTYTASTRNDGATITAGIYPNGLDTTWWIDYWRASGGSVQQTPTSDIGSGAAAVMVTGYPSHLASNTTYDYQLVAKNGDDTVYSYTDSFTTADGTAALPTAAFTSSPTPSVPDSAVTFNASTSTPASGDTITGYSWDFGDPNSADDTATGADPSHVYSSGGAYNVTLIVTDSDGQSESTTQTVIVDAPPTASFTVSPTPPAPGSPASFDSSSSSDSFGTITSYSWNFGDTGANGPGTSTLADPTYTYAASGNYTVTLTVTNDAGQTNTTTQTVTVENPPTVTITEPATSPTVITPGSGVSFSENDSPGSGGSITSCSWNFGDPSSGNSNTATCANPVNHTYMTAGIYTATVTVTDQLGGSASQSVQINVDTPPTASFTASPSQPAPGAVVTFNGSGSSDTVGYVSYSWNFGDSSPTSSSVQPQHSYASPGKYNVVLTVTNDAGESSQATQTVTVDDPPTASLTPSATVVTPGSAVGFQGTGSSPDGESINGYSWNFGDPSSGAQDAATQPDPSHTYASPGVYTVTLTATDDLEVQSAPVSTDITVDATPTAAFTASSNSVTAGSTVYFNGSGSSDSVGTITGYSWSFGDGTGSASEAPSHTYPTAGTYPVTLTVTNNAGQTASQTWSVTVSSVSSPTPPTTTSTPSPTPKPAPAPTPKPLTASLTGAKKQKLAPALAHGVRVSLAVSQATKASFQVTLPVLESRLAGPKHKTGTLVLLRLAQTLGAGNHAIPLKLSRAAARELAGSGPLVLTVKVTLTEASGGTISRTLKITLAR